MLDPDVRAMIEAKNGRARAQNEEWASRLEVIGNTKGVPAEVAFPATLGWLRGPTDVDLLLAEIDRLTALVDERDDDFEALNDGCLEDDMKFPNEE
jgi:hypothetical protein